MGLIEDTITLYRRELIIFKSNLRTNIIRSAIFPLVIILFFGNLGASTFGVKAAIVNYANNPASTSFINSLSSQRILSIVGIMSQGNALALLKKNSVVAVIVILPTFPGKSGGNPSVDVYYSNSEFQAVGAVLPFIQSQAQKYGSGISANTEAFAGSANNAGITSLIPLYGTSSSYKVF
ncbi:ABC-2 type transporter, partial [mine drainage metagenome]